MPLPGQDKNTPIPPELKRWNWGAFFLNWIWGLGNSTYIALLMFVPVINMVMPFVLGARGNEWAWRNRVWASEAEFVRTQRNWARAGLAVFVLMLGIFVALVTGLPALFKNSGAYQQSMEILRADPVAVATLGTPVKAGFWINGSIELDGADGTAGMAIPVSGPKCSGVLTSRAEKTAGVWDVYLLVLTTSCTKAPLVLRNSHNIRIPAAAQSEEI